MRALERERAIILNQLRPKDSQNSEWRKIPVALFTNKLTFNKVSTPSHTFVDNL